MPVDRNRLRFRTLDRQRLRAVGSDATLELLSFEQVSGEVPLATLTDGWSTVQRRDGSTSGVQVQIAEQDGLTDEIMTPNTGGVARFTILDRTYRVVPGGITPPMGTPRVWQLEGEEIRDNA